MTIDDATFDALLSESARRVSPVYWTPVAVARRAAEWLSAEHATHVVDLGSGVGKFCLTVALCSELRVRGVEQRAHLVTEAQRLTRTLGLEARVEFMVGDIASLAPSELEALYVFNPFSEHFYPPEARLDHSVEMSPERMSADVAALERVLDAMPVGSRFVTYHGFRGAIPDTFDLTRWEQLGDSMLRLWIKARSEPLGFRWAEVDEGLTLLPAAQR